MQALCRLGWEGREFFSCFFCWAGLSPGGGGALAAGAVGDAGARWFKPAAKEGEEGVEAVGEELGVALGGAVARVDLHDAGVEDGQAEGCGAAAVGEQAAGAWQELAQHTTAGSGGGGGALGGEAAEANVGEDGGTLQQQLRKRLTGG